MKKRLRKKLRLREFQEMGFTVDFDVQPASDESEEEITREYKQYNSLSNDLDELLRGLELRTAFGYGTLFVRAKPYKSVAESDRQLIINWIKQRPEAINLDFGPLADFKLTQRVYLRRPKWKSLPVRWSTH